jgi:hypothetical protein
MMSNKLKAQGFAVVVITKSRLPFLIPKMVIEGGIVEISGVKYYEAKINDWLGFYDWLRTKGGEVIGVRLTVDSDSDERVLFLNYEGVVVDKDRRTVHIWFTTSRGYDETISDDQDFGGNRPFRSQTGAVALTFNPLS